MKILYIGTVRLPTEKAHGVQIMKTCEAFAKYGIMLSLFVPDFSSTNDIKDDPFTYYDINRIFNLRKLFSIRLIRFGQIGFILENIIFFIGVIFTREFWVSDIIFSRDEILIALSSLFGRKTVWETHTGSYNIFAKISLKKSKTVVAISEGLKEYYVENGTKNEKIVVAHDSVDISGFEVRQTKNELRKKFGLDENSNIVLYVGRLDGWKGVRVFLDASKMFDEHTLALVIGGDKAEIDSLSKIYPEVIFWGYRPYKELPLYQKLADVLVVPNTGTNEVSKFFTSPLKVFAYMASEVPIVASDLPSIREILNEKNSVLVEPDNSKAFLNGIKKVLENGEFADTISKQALIDVKKYTWDKRVKNILSAINK